MPAGYSMTDSGLLVPAGTQPAAPARVRRRPRLKVATTCVVIWGLLIFAVSLTGVGLWTSIASAFAIVSGYDAGAGRGLLPNVRGPLGDRGPPTGG